MCVLGRTTRRSRRAGTRTYGAAQCEPVASFLGLLLFDDDSSPRLVPAPIFCARMIRAALGHIYLYLSIATLSSACEGFAECIILGGVALPEQEPTGSRCGGPRMYVACSVCCIVRHAHTKLRQHILRHTNTNTNTDSQTDTDTDAHKHRHRHRHRHGHIHADTQTQTQT